MLARKTMMTRMNLLRTGVNCNKFLSCGGKRQFSKNLWDMPNIVTLHKDFKNIQNVENLQIEYHAYLIVNIPPPFCPKCNQVVNINCKFSPVRDISIYDIDFSSNPNLIVNCPIFGELSTIFDNHRFNKLELDGEDI